MKVVVVGAGIAGLGAAVYFARRGHAVTVIEAAGSAGGRALTLRARRGDDRVDAGTQYYHSSYRLALDLFREAGLERTLAKIEGDTRFFDDRAPGGSFRVDHRLPWFRPLGPGNFRLWAFLARRLLGHRIDTYALAPHALDAERALDAVAHPSLREFALRPLTLAGSIAEPEAADPSLLHVVRLLRVIVLTDYLSPAGGVASLHDALGARLGVRLETPARRLVEERAGEGARVAGVEIEGRGEVIAADHVVVATTAPAALRLVPESWADERAFLASIVIPPFAFPTFFLDRPMPERNVWSWVTQRGRGRKVAIVLDAARKNPAMAPSGRSAVQPWPCFPGSRDLAGADDATIVDVCRREMEDCFSGFSSWIEEAHVTRHAGAVPFHPVGHAARALAFLRAADARGVSFCGDYLSGGYVEPALWSAERAARRHG